MGLPNSSTLVSSQLPEATEEEKMRREQCRSPQSSSAVGIGRTGRESLGAEGVKSFSAEVTAKIKGADSQRFTYSPGLCQPEDGCTL